MDGSGGSQGGERPSGLHALGQMALRRPLVAFLLILGLISLYPLEQFLANLAAYLANPLLREQAEQTRWQNIAASPLGTPRLPTQLMELKPLTPEEKQREDERIKKALENYDKRTHGNGAL